MQAATVRIETGYRPRPQQAALHKSLRRFNVPVCHRRFGKTVWAVNQCIHSSSRCDYPRPRYGYIAPLYRQAKAVAWDYLKGFTAAIPGRSVNEAELRVDLPWKDARIQLFGGDNPDSLRGQYFDGVILDEYAQMNPKVWSEVVRPAIADRKGWVAFIGTPKGRNAFCEIYEDFNRRMMEGDPDYFATIKRASETGIIDQIELDRARRDMTPEEFEQEFECSFQAAIVGAYYGRDIAQAEKEGRITGVPHDPRHRVYTAWDLGIGDSTAIWFVQLIGREIRVVDFYQASGVGLDHYAQVLDKKGYSYEDHLVPHDAEAKELGTGRTRREMLQTLGIRTKLVPIHRVEDGINAVRSILPRCWFDYAKTNAEGIEALRQYRRDWDEVMQVFKPKPRHDRWSHAADAFRCLAMGIDDVPEGVWIPPGEARFTGNRGINDYDPLNW